MNKKLLSVAVALSFVLSSLPYNSSKAHAENEIYDVKYGDVNADGSIDSLDIVSMRKIIGKTYNNALKHADLDGNQKIDDNDLSLLTYYCHSDLKAFPVHDDYDTDNDGLSDFIEYQYSKSAVNKKDTDDDGLTDYFETIILDSDPTIAGNEAKVDDDDDKLTNIDEQKYGTNPNLSDTDDDGLSDYYEINESKTDPLKADSDEDGINDGDEIKLKLDPLKKATDGSPDNERIIKQTISADSPILREINTEDCAYSLSLIINASGCAESNLSVKPSGYAYVMKDGSALGETPAFYYDDDFIVKDITLKFEIKEAFRDNVSHYFDIIDDDEDYYDYSYTIPSELDGIKRLNIFKYFEDVNVVMPIETQYDIDNNTVYATISKFESDEKGNSYGIGSYSLVDLEVWSDMMNNVEDTTQTVASSYNNSMSVTIGSDYNILTDEDSKIKKTLKKLSKTVLDAITKNYESYKASTANSEKNNSIQYFSLFDHKYACIESSEIGWTDAEAQCEKMGGHLMTINSPQELSLLDESLSSGKNGGFYWLGAVGGCNNWSWVTGESMNYARTIEINGYTLDTCPPYYFSHFGNRLVYVPHSDYSSEGEYPELSRIKGYICEWEKESDIRNIDGKGTVISLGSKKITLNGPISASSGIDTDKDGKSDYDEIDFNAIKKIGGSSAQIVTWQQSYDYLKKKGYISDKPYNRISDIVSAMAKSQEIYPTKYNPVDIDTDNDGINDDQDPNPILKDITITNISHEEYLKISREYDQYYGSSQSWLNDLDKTTLNKYGLSSSNTCGLVAAGDLIAYLNLYGKINMKEYADKKGFSELTDTNINDLYDCFGYNESDDTIDYLKYMNYIAKLSTQIEVKDILDINGVFAFGCPKSIKSCLKEILNYDNNYKYQVNWRNDNSFDTLKSRIEQMLDNNLPVIIAYGKDLKKEVQNGLPLYESKNGIDFKHVETAGSHYMVITELINFSEEMSKISKHSTMVKVGSCGEELYFDLNEYCLRVNLEIMNYDENKEFPGYLTYEKLMLRNNFESNILEIRR